MQPFLALITPVGDSGGGSPPGIWGGANQPFPTPPIHMPTPPVHIWGGGNVPMPTPPIHLGPGAGSGIPTHPIYYPPIIWGPNDPRPGVGPIIPPEGGAGETPREPVIEWKTAWSPSTGWIVVGVPTVPHPAPSTGGEGQQIP